MSWSIRGKSVENWDPVIAGCRTGDPEARRKLYEACAERVFFLMVHIVGRQEAADVTQQVFLQVFQKIDRYEGRSRFETWLYRLAVNEAYQFLRKERRWDYGPLGHQPCDKHSAVEDVDQQRKLLDEALRRIDPKLRAIFLLREVEELSYQEIADALDIPEGTVGSRLNRTRSELRNVLSNLGWEDE